MNLLKYNSWAVVINNEKSDAIKIIKKLKDNGYEVVGINATNFHIEDIEIYESLKDVPYNIEIVVIIEESIETYMIFEEMELLDIKNIWFMENSYNQFILKKAKEMKLNIESKLDLYEELSR